MTEKFKNYLEKYIELLAGNQTEYFIAIVDVEKELVMEFLQNKFSKVPYQTVWVERNDYADAVRQRNNPEIRQIVLLSSDSVKMIDSLKDFVEYPIIPENLDILWECIKGAFGVELDSECRKILGTVLEQKQISLEDLLEYIGVCCERGKCTAEKMVANLYRFEIWSIKKLPEGENLKKQQLLRMIRSSSPLLVETRLLGEITGGKTEFSEKEEKEILRCLSQNDLQRLFRNISYDERIERLFKGNHQKREIQDKEKLEEQQYENSYQYVIQENIQHSIKKVEEELSQGEENVLSESIWLFEYPETVELTEKFERIKKDAARLNFTEKKRAEILKSLDELETCAVSAVENGKTFPPPYLYHYVEGQKEFIEAYFRFLGKCLADDGIVRNCIGMDILGRMQNLFCEEKNGELTMPFYHPLVGAYYWKLQKKLEEYQSRLSLQTDRLGHEVITTLSQIEQMNFPVQYMVWERQLYQLDYNSLQNWNPYVVFRRAEDYTAGSWINIRIFNEDLVDYIKRQPFLPEIRVTIVDLNDIREIESMIERLQRLPDSRECMVHKVILNIVSEKEEELKRQLQESMDIDIDYPQVLFRFTRNLYQKGREYELKKIIEHSDLLFLADSRILYQKPRLSAWQGESGWFRIQMEKLNVEKMLDAVQEENQLEILWDSIHYIELEEEGKITCWKTREFRQTIFPMIQDAVKQYPDLTVVVMSSNSRALHHIYHTSGFQARKSIVPGKEMLILNYHKGCRRKKLHDRGKTEIGVSLKPFLEGVLGAAKTESLLYAETEEEKPWLVMSYEADGLGMRLEVNVENALSDSQERREHYEELAKSIEGFFHNDTWFKQKLITMFYERADSYSAALTVDFLERTEKMPQIEYRETVSPRLRKNVDADIVSILEFQDMMEFIRKWSSIDERTVNRFRNFYREETLRYCLAADQSLHILENETRRKMEYIYKVMENTNE